MKTVFRHSRGVTRRALAAVVVLSFGLLLGVLHAPTQASASSTANAVTDLNLLYSNRPSVRAMFDGINKYRKANGLSPAVLTLAGTDQSQGWTNDWQRLGIRPADTTDDLPGLRWAGYLSYACMSGQESEAVKAWIEYNGDSMKGASPESAYALGVGVAPGLHGSLRMQVVGYEFTGSAPSTVFTTVDEYFAYVDAANAFTAPAASPFQDIKTDQQFYKEMTWLSAKSISAGWKENDGSSTYRPLTSVSREAMAAFIYRMAGSPPWTPPQTSAYVDVPTSHPFYKEIAWLAMSGISTGWENQDGSSSFRPGLPISRDAMAAFLYRASGYPAYTPPAVSPFQDVAPQQQFYKEMAWLSARGISTGWTENTGQRTYRPLTLITRDAMAAFLYRIADKAR
ncbi:S-layer homology domain-containing protein [Arthrobacter sp. Rue61a]|uniref:S-layer homology domain-containing protein n=1 Tax=Arthrobacter sp. Rue61a TaxID=1118963 RepID=UPI0002E79BC2|nr:S-layer homology domain-containing protein [Arthrobacter sp. Rue61a]